jgi:hypothetical protein
VSTGDILKLVLKYFSTEARQGTRVAEKYIVRENDAYKYFIIIII